jgi:hypothetical protein
VSESDVEMVCSAWGSFSRGDLATATAVLAPDARWYGADDPGDEGGCHSRDEALRFIERSLADGITAKLLDIHDAGDRLVAVVEARTPPEAAAAGRARRGRHRPSRQGLRDGRVRHRQ